MTRSSSLSAILLRHALLLASAAILVMLAIFFTLPRAAAADGPVNRADVVVQFGNGLVETRRITFTGTLSGLAALRATGLPLVENTGGICRIGDTGCRAAQACFCECAPPAFAPCLFWEYSRFGGGSWASSLVGAGATTLTDGAVEGYSWGRSLPVLRRPVLAARAANQWLRGRQRADGSFGSVGSTIEAALAGAAAGETPGAWTNGSGNGATLATALRTGGAVYANSGVAQAGKLALGIAALDEDPRTFLQPSLVLTITAAYDGASGAYGFTNWDHAYAILGLAAAGEPVPVAARTLLASRANPDGGWDFSPGGLIDSDFASDVDSTGLMLQALAVAGEPANSTRVVAALAFLAGVQEDDGGFPYTTEPAATSNANSTAFAIQGLLAAGQDPLAARWQPTAITPIDYLLNLQLADGALTFGGQANQFATAQAAPALMGRTLPLRARAVGVRLALAAARAQQKPDGSFNGFGIGSTIDAVLAIRAAGGDPNAPTSTGATAAQYLAGVAPAYATSAAARGKLLAGVVALGADPQRFGGLNLVSSTTATYNAANGQYGTSVWDQSWAMIGLASAGQTIPISATQRFAAIATPGGGWGFAANDPAPDADSTGLALQALAAAERQQDATYCTTGLGSRNSAVRAGIAWLRSAQNRDGGFAGFDGSTSATSTGLALQGLAAHGEVVRGLAWTTAITDSTGSLLVAQNPVDRLLRLQGVGGGSPGTAALDEPDAIYQALAGATGRAYPVRQLRLTYLARIGR